MSVVKLDIKHDIAIIRVNNPPLNALSQELRAALRDAAAEISANNSLKAAILICDGRSFIPGADIREFNSAPKAPSLPEVINHIEASPLPWIAAIHGSALGGGLELALGCHYRIAVSSAKTGLPEVNLGILPGAGGTIRLPRLTDLDFALNMITSGKPISAQAAFDAGIIDALVPHGEELDTFAMSYAQRIKSIPKPAPLSARRPKFLPDDEWWQQKLAQTEQKAKGQISPLEAAKIVRNGLEKPFADALADERACFLKLKEGAQSKAMRYSFFAEREIAKIPFIKDVAPAEISKVTIIGGGIMGAGISAATLLKGHRTTMIEQNEELAQAGHQRVMAILDSSQKRGIISEEQRSHITSLFSSQVGYDRLWDDDIVIEAVFEDMDVKKQVFAELDKFVPKQCILATNSSYLDVDEIATVVSHPARLIGLHFFSPAHIMKLVEVIKTDTVSPETFATSYAFVKKLGKSPVYSGVCDGFIGNRIIYEYRKICDYMVEDGAWPQDIDAAMRDFGMAMGPYQMADMAGLDLGWATRKRRAATRDPNERYVKIGDRICELGRFGQKTGAGWYDYSSDKRNGQVDPLVEKLILEEAKAHGITRRPFTSSEIQHAVVAMMAQEGRKILDEGIALRESDIDMVMILGYGFPRWRGGPMFMASQNAP